MRVALTAVLDGVPDALARFLDFHRSAGVDVVVLGHDGVERDVAPAVASYERDGFVRLVDGADDTMLARVAVDELAADWVIPATLEQLWWPRGESLGDILAVVPARYAVVQALVRTFVPRMGEADTTAESRTIRTSLLGPDGAGGVAVEELLRPLYRGTPGLTIDRSGWTLGGRLIPLRAWYPVEVLHFPRGGEPLDRARIDAGLADGSLIVDERLRDAFGSREAAALVASGIVDDASYAVECAAVGEVDLVRLDREIRQLELRIASLEARFWPSLRRAARKLVRRPG